jgi:hypothetical protein
MAGSAAISTGFTPREAPDCNARQSVRTIRPTSSDVHLCSQASPSPPLLITGYRERRDSWSKRVAAYRQHDRAFSGLYAGHRLRAKAVSTIVFLICLFLTTCKFLPALVLREGGTVLSVPNQSPAASQGNVEIWRSTGWGWGHDLLGVMWLQRRASRPRPFLEVTLAAEPVAADDPSPSAIAAVR